MIELLIITEPLECQAFSASIQKYLVNRHQVLDSSHGVYEVVGGLHHWLVTHLEAQGEPSLLAFGVEGLGDR